jgi:IclR family acetate operon transcriptional repressor
MAAQRKKNNGGVKVEPARRAASGESGKIQSLKRAAAILDVVARKPEGISLAQLSTELDLHSSTAFHLIQTLVGLGFLTQLADRRYRIGTRLFTLAAGALDETALLSLATPILERLSADTGHAAHLAVRFKNEIIVVARTAATGLLQLAGHPGATRPAHATAIGKMLLAAMPPEDFQRLLKTQPLPAVTPHTLTVPASLRREIDSVRRTGIAHDNCELDADVRCIAVPVHDFAGRSAAAMGLSGPPGD